MSEALPAERPDESTRRISVLIADDLPLLVDALKDLLEGDPSIVVVETANDAAAAVEAAAAARPDVALLDVRMPAGGGVAAARGIREVSPDTRIVALSAHFDRASVVEMIRAGAIGYVIKGSAPEEIIAAVHGSVRGESNLSPEVTGQIMQELVRSLARAEELSTELVELNRMKTELVQILAHELFTPITTIQGTAATLAVSDGRLSGEEMRDLAAGVERAAGRLRRLVANIGAVVSLEREATLPTHAVPLRSIVDDALGEFAPTEDGTIDTQITDELLVSEVLAHQALASRALVLVTENALDFRNEAAVEVRAVGDDEEIWLEVSDRGPGIPSDQRDRVFELFTQVEWMSSRSHEGLGIGLFLAKRIMEAHRGWLDLRDREGGGATFVLAFPRAVAPLRRA